MSGRRVHKTHFTQPEMPWKKDKEETVELKVGEADNFQC